MLRIAKGIIYAIVVVVLLVNIDKVLAIGNALVNLVYNALT